MKPVLLLSLVCLLLTSLQASESQNRASPPNILFVLIDDLGWADLGYNGANYHLTPKIDAFAEKALVFNRSYTMPSCSPSRASLFTGLNAPHTGIYHVEAFAGQPSEGIKKTVPIKSGHFYEKPITMLADSLKQSGYATGYVGKWHVTDDPTQHGFDFNAGGWGKGGPKSYFSPYHNPALEDGPEGEYLPERLMNESIKFIRENKDAPFFLCYAPYSVHRPLQARQSDIEYYEKRLPEKARSNPTYAAMVGAMDTAFGGILDALESEGLADNTVVIFTSDNGMNGLCGDSDPLRGEKGSCYEGGVRVPTLVYWPGKTAAKSIDALIDVTDWYPTLLDISQSPAPQHQLDGLNIVPLLTGEKDSVRDSIYSHMPCYNGNPQSPQIWQTPYSSITEDRYKLIYSYEDDSLELYDLIEDIGETTNLAHSKPEVANQLHRKLKSWLSQNEAPLPTPKQ